MTDDLPYLYDDDELDAFVISRFMRHHFGPLLRDPFLEFGSVEHTQGSDIVFITCIDEEGDEEEYHVSLTSMRYAVRRTHIETVDQAPLLAERATSESPSLVIPPGSKLLEWSRFIFPKKFAEGEITHTINDMQREYIESIAENRKWHPKWVCTRGYMSWSVCVFCWMLGGVGKRIVDAWKGVNPS